MYKAEVRSCHDLSHFICLENNQVKVLSLIKKI